MVLVMSDSAAEKFTKVCCVCSVTVRIPECECVCHGSAAEKALAEIKQLENSCSLGLAARWHSTAESIEIIKRCGKLFPKVSRMRRALEAVLALPQSPGHTDGWNKAIFAVRSAIEHELGPFAPEDGKHA